MNIIATIPIQLRLTVDVDFSTGKLSTEDAVKISKLGQALVDNIQEALKGTERQLMSGVPDYIETNVDLDSFMVVGVEMGTTDE